MGMRLARGAAQLIVAALASGGCEAESTRAPGLEAEVRDSANVRIMKLSHTLTQVASGEVSSLRLQEDLRLGEGEIWFGAVADIAALPGGRFAVFDRMEKHIDVFDSQGRRTARYGREGEGPGEYRLPWALASVGEALVAWQAAIASAFTVLGADGRVLATGPRSAKGDWARPAYRFPMLDLEGTQRGPEDVTRRLAPYGDSAFVVQLQVDEQMQIDPRAPVDFPSPPVYLIRYGMDARIRDTIAVLTGPPTLFAKHVPNVLPFYEQPLFSGRPVWATGSDWIATGHGDSAQVVVQKFSGDTTVIIRWPDRRREVSDAEKIDAAKWRIAVRVLNSSYTRKYFERASADNREWGVREEAFRLIRFAQSAPTLTAAYGVADCLFLSGYAPSDWGDGTSLTWVAVNVERASLEAVIRIPPPRDTLVLGRRGAAVRAFDERFVYSSHRNGDGVFIIQRYRLPTIDCGK